jgi:hypothetical protein
MSGRDGRLGCSITCLVELAAAQQPLRDVGGLRVLYRTYNLLLFLF